MTTICRPLCDPNQDPAGYARAVDQYVEVLCEFTPDGLRAGMKRLREDWTSGVWPVPGMVRKFTIEAQKEATKDLPRLAAPEHARYRPNGGIPKAERDRVAGHMRRWAALMNSGDFAGMTHEQAYDAVYQGEMGEAHKADMMRRCKGLDG